MFTGIIEEVGQIAAIEPLGGGRRLKINAKMAPELRPDQSVAVNGVCQTVVRTDRGAFEVVAIEETLRKTTFGSLAAGDSVNLERALRTGDRLDGHFVQGHVDTTGEIVRVERLATSRMFTVRFPPGYAPYLIPVGSIAVDGISLTVARLEEETFTVAIIPHTLGHTNVGGWREGTPVNLEFDLIGKYILRRLSAGSSTGAITEAWLREQGF